jgi:hypothetical protein
MPTTPTHQATVREHQATEPGALDGFAVECPDCPGRPVFTTTLRFDAAKTARDHQEFMTTGRLARWTR